MPKLLFSGVSIRLAAVLLIGCFIGCSPDPIEVENQGDGYGNLMAIQTAYRQFVEAKKKPPSSEDDLIPFGLKADSFISPRDGKPLKIYWGSSLNETNFDHPTVIAHEVDGKDGKRLVLSTVGVMMLTDKEFAIARFPSSQ
jgi:hypothetical protein